MSSKNFTASPARHLSISRRYIKIHRHAPGLTEILRDVTSSGFEKAPRNRINPHAANLLFSMNNSAMNLRSSPCNRMKGNAYEIPILKRPCVSCKRNIEISLGRSFSFFDRLSVKTYLSRECQKYPFYNGK